MMAADLPRGGADARPGSRSSCIPVPAPTLPSATSGAQRVERPRTRRPPTTVRESARSPSSHSPTTGITTFWGRGRIPNRRLDNGADGVGAAQVHRRLHVPDLVDLEVCVEHSRPVDHRDAGGGRQGGRIDHRHAGALPALGLLVADPHAGHVGDRVPRARPQIAPTGPAMSRQRSGTRALLPACRQAPDREGGRRRADPCPRPGAASGQPCRTARSASGSAGGSGSPPARSVGSGSSPREQLALAAAAGHRARGSRPPAPACRGAAGARSRPSAVPLLDDPAEVHDRDPVAERPREAEVVGDEEEAEPALSRRSQQHIEDLRPDRGVEHRDRLVADQAVRLEDERGGDRDPLALAAGELVGVAVEVALRARVRRRPSPRHRASRCSALRHVRTTSGSATIVRTRWRGFRVWYGSWKIICTRRRRSSEAGLAARPARRRAATSPSAGSTRPSIARASVDLPQPDSPDHAQDLALLPIERDAVHGPRRPASCRN